MHDANWSPLIHALIPTLRTHSDASRTANLTARTKGTCPLSAQNRRHPYAPQQNVLLCSRANSNKQSPVLTEDKGQFSLHQHRPWRVLIKSNQTKSIFIVHQYAKHKNETFSLTLWTFNGIKEKERERERDRDRETDRDRQRQKQIDRQRETETDRQTETETQRDRDRERLYLKKQIKIK